MRTIIRHLVVLLVLAFAVSAQASSATLEWNANEPEPEGYQLFRKLAGEDYDYNKPVYTGTETRFTDECPDGNTCFWVVRAFDGDNESGDSNEVFVTLPGIPTDIQIHSENNIMHLITAPVASERASSYQVVIGTQTIEAPAESVDEANVRLHFNLNNLGLSDGAHSGTIACKNGWGVGNPVPFEFVKVSPGVPSGIGLSVD